MQARVEYNKDPEARRPNFDVRTMPWVTQEEKEEFHRLMEELIRSQDFASLSELRQCYDRNIADLIFDGTFQRITQRMIDNERLTPAHLAGIKAFWYDVIYPKNDVFLDPLVIPDIESLKRRQFNPYTMLPQTRREYALVLRFVFHDYICNNQKGSGVMMDFYTRQGKTEEYMQMRRRALAFEGESLSEFLREQGIKKELLAEILFG